MSNGPKGACCFWCQKPGASFSEKHQARLHAACAPAFEAWLKLMAAGSKGAA